MCQHSKLAVVLVSESFNTFVLYVETRLLHQILEANILFPAPLHLFDNYSNFLLFR